MWTFSLSGRHFQFFQCCFCDVKFAAYWSSELLSAIQALETIDCSHFFNVTSYPKKLMVLGSSIFLLQIFNILLAFLMLCLYQIPMHVKRKTIFFYSDNQFLNWPLSICLIINYTMSVYME